MLEQYNEILTIDELCEILMIGKNFAYRLLTEKKSKRSESERNGKSLKPLFRILYQKVQNDLFF